MGSVTNDSKNRDVPNPTTSLHQKISSVKSQPNPWKSCNFPTHRWTQPISNSDWVSYVCGFIDAWYMMVRNIKSALSSSVWTTPTAVVKALSPVGYVMIFCLPWHWLIYLQHRNICQYVIVKQIPRVIYKRLMLHFLTALVCDECISLL